MPPKVASSRGRRKAAAKKTQNGYEPEMKSEDIKSNGQDLIDGNSDVMNGDNNPNKKVYNKSCPDIPSKDKNSDGYSEASETVNEKKGDLEVFTDANAVTNEKLEEIKNTNGTIGDSNSTSQINDLSEKDSNLNKVAPVKQGRKLVKNLAKSQKLIETVESASGADKVEESLAETVNNVVSTELSKSDVSDNDKVDLATNVDISNDKDKPNSKIPLKRGRPRKNAAMSDNAPNEQLKTEEKIPLKRGRRANIPSNFDKSPVLKEVPAEKIVDEQLEAVKAPPKRGRKKANIPQKNNSSDVNTVKKEMDKKSPTVIKEQKSGKNIQSKEIASKPGRKKANQKMTIDGFNDKESNQKVKELNQDIIEKEELETNFETASADENTDQISLELKEPSSLGHKRKNETSGEQVEKNKSGFNETKVLKVALLRDANIDDMFQNQAKVIEKVGNKNVKTGSKRTKGDVEDSESNIKAPKLPKGEGGKGQSKKDKMPDVTLLDFGNNSTSPSQKPWNLKISSWNVNGIRACLEKNCLAYITHENPDIMTFQETKCSDKNLPKEINISGYHSYWLAGDKDGYSGVGLLSKIKPISVNYGIGIEEHDKEGRVITAEYEAFYLVTTYIPNAGRGLVRLDYRMQWDKDFRAFIKKLDEKKPVILCGDLNVAHEEIDLAKPKANKKNAGFTKEEREGFTTLLAEGFIDSFRHLYPSKKDAYTFWTYMMNARAKNVGWRLDYFVLSQKLTDHLCDNVIRKDVFGSDHCPITLFLSV